MAIIDIALARTSNALFGGYRGPKSHAMGAGRNVESGAPTSKHSTRWLRGKYSCERLQFPFNVESDPHQGHYIIFDIKKYKPAVLEGLRAKQRTLEKAFQNARKDPIDATAYINLEPCSISSKTPPCTDILIQNSISEVYVSMLDPNPDIHGEGIEILKRAGIKVHLGILESEAESLNRPFKKWINLKSSCSIIVQNCIPYEFSVIRIFVQEYHS